MIHFLVSIYIDSTPYNYFITDLNEGDECIINYQSKIKVLLCSLHQSYNFNINSIL